MLFQKTILKAYRNKLCLRYDGTPLLRYFGVQDFAGLVREPFSFVGDKGQRLQGYFYFYGDKRADRFVIFDHGVGGGHDSYVKEIERLARHGYTVFSYDHTGCKESEGENIVGFSQSVNDLDHAVKALRATDEYKSAALSVVGHSWGGFATLNIPKLHPDIESCVALSGFIGVKRMLEQQFSGLLKCYRKAIFDYEAQQNPTYALMDARQSLSDTATRVLVIHSADDPVVRCEYHFDTLQAALSNPNVAFLQVDGKAHNPNYTTAAVKLLGEMTSDMTRGIKEKSFATEKDMIAFRDRWNWDAITEQDEELWQTILDFLDQRDAR